MALQAQGYTVAIGCRERVATSSKKLLEAIATTVVTRTLRVAKLSPILAALGPWALLCVLKCCGLQAQKDTI